MIARYTDAIQKAIGSKIKAEPWLHIAFFDNGATNYYVIYVWDTRKVVYQGKTADDLLNIDLACNGMTPANDNHEPLNGQHDKILDRLFKKK